MPVTAAALQLVLDRARTQDPLGAAIRHALDVIDGVLDDYGEDHVAMSFNGGKDCTVLIHLLAAALYRRHPSHATDTPPYPTPIPALYITAPLPFAALDAFVHTSATWYGLDLIQYGGGMKRALAEFQASHTGQGVGAFFIGTRRGDPHGAKLGERTPTDPGWPRFMRVHPILEWRYADVWAFLRECRVPYCELYDQGYTSLGSTNNTHPNPCLLRPRSEDDNPAVDEPTYDPAYMLTDESKERAGRDDVVAGPRTTNGKTGEGKEP
ncbi:hypothetical protein NliqN6_0844 [Naganishia liquefaciens]|uniref:FAD synthase n=1 Tax=Naganishia liquefaciens TaxID=104408 RepID=A0A8H3TNR8_9TREE|nr:hypothetical protein NliqN6_0844 [Naganishia liquefaciens]